MDIKELKKLQKEIIKKNKILNITSIVLFLTIIIIATSILLINKANTEQIIFCLIVIAFLSAIICIVIIALIKSILINKKIKTFKQEFKTIFVLNSLKKYFENLTYNAEKGFDESLVEKNNMIDTGDSFHSNDYIEGTYKNINFSQSDIHIEEKHEEEDSDGNKKEVWVTTFLGRLMIFDFNKTFKANLQVVSNHFYARSLKNKIKYNKIKLEDPEFNKAFTVYAENEHEAFYILTPHFMDRIKEITNKLNCEIMFFFTDNKLHIAINNSKDSFEWNVLKPINEQTIEENITKDIKVITDFIDELNLNNDLFRKEV